MLSLLMLVSFSVLGLSIAFYFDSRKPGTQKLKNRYRVKETSILRTVFKFKDTAENPCNYFKVIPLLLASVCTFLLVLFWLTDLLCQKFISSNLHQAVFIILLSFLLSFYLYFSALCVWWEHQQKKDIQFLEEAEKTAKTKKFLRESFRK